MNEIFEMYIEDLKENLINLSEALIHMEKGDRDDDLINSIFRVAHTIKGNSAAMEFYNIQKVMHTMENILHEIRSGSRVLTERIVKALYSCHDFLEDALSILEKESCDKSIETGTILQELQEISSEEKPDDKDVKVKLELKEDFNIDAELKEVLLANYKRGFMPYEVKVVLSEDCLMKSLRAWLISQFVGNYGSIIAAIPRELSEELLGEEDFVISDNTIRFMIVTDNNIDELVLELLGVVEVDKVEKRELIEELKEKKSSNKIEPEIISKEYIKTELDTQSIKNRKPNEKQDTGFIRIPVGKVDGLMDMLGELLILNSQFAQQVEENFENDSVMSNTLSRTAKLIKEIQGLSMSLRMIEIRPTLHRLHRIIRDTAEELNKKVSVLIEGEETEIDRSAAEKIFDPLMHLVRNAVSHGIEDEEERIKNGKRPEGKITIRAYSKRGNVYFQLSDDGGGINTKKVLKKAIDLKMAEDNKEYSEEEIIRFIFKPGFSTQEQINNISGRGVGMNVVDEIITHMGGKIEIQNDPGKGCTFIIKIPMNLAVMNGTIIEVAGGRYIIPTLFIKEFFIIDDNSWISMKGQRQILRIRDKIIPVINASKIFDIHEKDEVLYNRREIIILELDQKLLAFPVDKIFGRQEIVSKPLDFEFANINYAAGASILGDGNVSLILDAEAIFKMVELQN
ncbi:chemotaxis protein CheA [Clostridium sp. PL3]|uniref:Chemotaxis protein CheA n=1 Tax=Clostridium thailandense TaxID=2794346 RepID=A0A949X623_9CLOT|nr:chemotaxis protein CheA [Clostridium thailandense]MBV7276618.1 chemotaxis protein CheA [Clostridium thailandense]